MGNVEALFGNLILKVALTLALLLAGVVFGQLTARRLGGSRGAQQVWAKLVALVVGAALVYWLVLSRAAIV